MTQAPIRVLIVDDHVMVRKGLIALLAAYDDMELAGEAEDGEMGVLLYEHALPDVVLMDMVMPRMDGANAISKIRARHANAQIVALTSFDSDELVQRAMAAGAIGYLLKNATAEDLARAIRAAHNGKRTLSPEAADSMMHLLNPEPVVGADLTVREREVLSLMVEGFNNTEISDRLFLSVSTIKFHVSTLLSKLAVSNRIEAVALAVKHNLFIKKS